MYAVGGGGRFAKTQVLSCCKWFLRFLRRFDQSRDGHGRYIDRANLQYVPR